MVPEQAREERARGRISAVHAYQTPERPDGTGRPKGRLLAVALAAELLLVRVDDRGPSRRVLLGAAGAPARQLRALGLEARPVHPAVVAQRMTPGPELLPPGQHGRVVGRRVVGLREVVLVRPPPHPVPEPRRLPARRPLPAPNTFSHRTGSKMRTTIAVV